MSLGLPAGEVSDGGTEAGVEGPGSVTGAAMGSRGFLNRSNSLGFLLSSLVDERASDESSFLKMDMIINISALAGRTLKLSYHHFKSFEAPRQNVDRNG
jgi:hypothetical protein